MTSEEAVHQVSQYPSHDHADGDLTDLIGKREVVPEIIESEKGKNSYTAQNKIFSMEETPGCSRIAPMNDREKAGNDLMTGIERDRMTDDYFRELIQYENDSHQQKHPLCRCSVDPKIRF